MSKYKLITDEHYPYIAGKRAEIFERENDYYIALEFFDGSKPTKKIKLTDTLKQFAGSIIGDCDPYDQSIYAQELIKIYHMAIES